MPDTNTDDVLRRAASGTPDFPVRLISALPQGVIIQVEGFVRYANAAAAKMADVADTRDLLGVHFFELVDPGSRSAILERAVRFNPQSEWSTQPVRLTLRNMSGRRFEADVTSVSVRLDSEPAVLHSITDISPRVEAEEHAHVADERLRSLMDESPLGILIFGVRDNVPLLEEANIAAEHILQRPIRSRLGVAFHELLADFDEDLLESVRRSACEPDDPSMAHAMSLTLPSGPSYLDARVYCSEPGRLVLFVWDVTARVNIRKALETRERDLEREVNTRTKELVTANAELRQATQAKSAFLASMSHELRTPLNSIIGFSGAMLQGLAGPLSDEQDRQLTMINRSGRQLLSLINDVLDLAKIESGHTEIRVRQFDAIRLMLVLAESLRPLAAEKGLDMGVFHSPGPVIMCSDRLKVEQILLNLVGNAVKYTRAGRIELNLVADESCVTFEVSDTGVGIPPDKLELVFEEFSQLVSEGRAKSPGTGLGLSIARNLVVLLGGTIDVESTVNVGSTFRVQLPRVLDVPLDTC